MSKERSTHDKFQRIIDTFTGTDGGIEFVALKAFVNDMVDDPNLIKIIDQMDQLIDVAKEVYFDEESG